MYIHSGNTGNTDIIKRPREHAVHFDEERTGLQSKRNERK